MTGSLLKVLFFSKLILWAPRWTFSREKVPFHICEQTEPELVSVSVHSLLSISTFVHTRNQVMGLHANGGGLDQTA